MLRASLLVALFMGLPFGSLAQESAPQVQSELDSKQAEMTLLRNQSQDAMNRMAALAQNAELMATDEGVAQLQAIVDELRAINAKLNALQSEVDGLKKRVEALEKAKPSDSSKGPAWKWGGYLQTQFRSQTGNSAAMGFRVRRAELDANVTLSPRMVGKISYEFASGTNQNAGQLRDAFWNYDAIPGRLQFRVGQMRIRFGTENPTSGAGLDYPERARFNSAYFDGERIVGAAFTANLNSEWTLVGSVSNSLTTNDPEQRGFGNDARGRRLAGLIGARWKSGDLDFGVSYLEGDRPEFAVTKGPNAADPSGIVAPRIRRKLNGVDAAWSSKSTFLRGELMWGIDRENLGLASNVTTRPNAGAFDSARVRGWQILGGYTMNFGGTLMARFEGLDPDLRTDGNAIQSFGLGYAVTFAPNSKLIGWYEQVREPGRTFQVWTIRTTVRF